MGVISAGTASRRHPSPIITIVSARAAQGKSRDHLHGIALSRSAVSIAGISPIWLQNRRFKQVREINIKIGLWLVRHGGYVRLELPSGGAAGAVRRHPPWIDRLRPKPPPA
jgi:hypothetical protein